MTKEEKTQRDREYQKRYREKNKEKISKNNKNYYEHNKEVLKSKQNEKRRLARLKELDRK
jgi:hypothetical protein